MQTLEASKPAVATLSNVTLPEKIKTETDVNTVARELILLNREVAKVDEEDVVIAAKKVIADAQARQQELGQRATNIANIYDPQITKFGKRKCDSAGVKAWETALLGVKFTWCPDIVVDVTDAKLAIPFLKLECPTGVIEKPTVNKTGFTAEFKAKCADMKPAELLKKGMRVASMPHDSVKIWLKHEDILKV